MELVKVIDASVSAYKENPSAKHEERRQFLADLLIQRYQEWRDKYDSPKVVDANEERCATLADLATPPKNADENYLVSTVVRPLPFVNPLVGMSLDFLIPVCGSAALMLRAEGVERGEAIKQLNDHVSRELDFIEDHLWDPASQVPDIDRAHVQRLCRNLRRAETRTGLANFFYQFLELGLPETTLAENVEKLRQWVERMELSQLGAQVSAAQQIAVPTVSHETRGKAEKAIQKVRTPSENDWYWYNRLLGAGVVQNDKLKGDEDSREKLLDYFLKSKQTGPTKTIWYEGWRTALSPEGWRANTKNFFENKVRKCFAWEEAHPGEKRPTGKKA